MANTAYESRTVISPDRDKQDPIPYSDDPFAAVRAYAEAFPSDSGIEEITDDYIRLGLHWDFCPCRHIVRYANALLDVTTTTFDVPPRNEWKQEDKASVNITIRRGRDAPPETVQYQELVSRLGQYHPLRPNGTASELDRTCDSVSDLLTYAIYHEFGIPNTRTYGNIYSPTRGQVGEEHAFNVIPPRFIENVTQPVIVDGTAKQYTDENDDVVYPSFGSQDSVPLVQVVRASDPRYEYYRF